MQPEYDALQSLNVEIGRAEARGDAGFFDDLLAPVFVLRGADGKRMDGRDKFIEAMSAGPARTTEVDGVTFFGPHRALVVCRVTLEVGGEMAHYSHLRLFTRRGIDARWQLLAWANERIA